ncbi:MAG: TlpA disulfide reductase family protein [Betaproteobacteria bacterium]
MNVGIYPRLALGLALLGGVAVGIWIFDSRLASPPAPALAPEPAGVLRVHATPVAVRDLAFEDGAGRPRSLADFRGRYVLLNVWGTWCAPCREEMPALSRLQQKLGGPGFEVVALAIDAGGAEAVRRFYREIGVDALGIYVDRSMQASAALRVVGVPSTLLLDREGREIARHVGPAEWDSAPALESIRRLIAPGSG